MVFSEILFLFYFLPIFLLCYFISPVKCKNFTLLIFSLIFYAWGEPVYILLLLLSSIVDYVNGRALEHFEGNRKIQNIFLVISVVVNLGMMGIFKYSGLFIESINSVFGTEIKNPELALPLGISFFTFQTMSYSIDVYRKDIKAEHNFLDYMTYVSMFPQLVAGPIVRYEDIGLQLKTRKSTVKGITEGTERFLIGLFKKVLIANQIGSLWDMVLVSPERSFAYAWLGLLAFSFQIYFDFSGYSDMAIGLGKIMGFDYPENFNYPYISTSITDFWRRWHISLGTWFKEYVYIPLGGNRVSPLRKRFNLLVVWLLAGFWHGAGFNFILWGLYYAVLLILEKEVLGKYIEKLPRLLKTLYSMFFVLIGWVFFASPTLLDALSYLGAMFGIGANGFTDGSSLYAISSYGTVFVVGAVVMLPLGKKLFTPLWKKNPTVFLVPCVTIFMLCVAYLADASYNPFLYFRF